MHGGTCGFTGNVSVLHSYGCKLYLDNSVGTGKSVYFFVVLPMLRVHFQL